MRVSDPQNFYIRPFRESDRETVAALGQSVIDWWNEHGALSLVVGDPVIAYLQIVDRSITPAQRIGRTEMRLTVAPAYRRQGIGSQLYNHALTYVRTHHARTLRAAYLELTPEEPGCFFLKKLGFVELQRFCPSYLEVAACDLTPFAGLASHLAAQGIRIIHYTDVPNTPENQHRLYALEQAARQDIPFCETELSEQEPFEDWLASWAEKDRPTLLLAEVNGEWIGMTSGISWAFTGVRKDYRGRGVATALKVQAIREAKARGVERLETENHANNAPMLAVNRKLGYQFGPFEVECIKYL